MADDRQLLERFRQADDRAALDTLLTRHYPGVYRVILNLVHDEADASDLAQATFTRVLEKGAGYRGTGGFRAWLRQIAVNEVRQHWRRRRRAPAPDPLFEAYLQTSRHDAPTVASRREFEQELSNALATFPPRLKLPLVLHYYEDLPLAEVAATLGLPRSTVQSRCERAVARLRRHFEKRGFRALVPLLSVSFPELGGAAARTVPVLAKVAAAVLVLVAGTWALWSGVLAGVEREPAPVDTAAAATRSTPAPPGATAVDAGSPERIPARGGDAAAAPGVLREVHTTGPGSIVGRFVRMPGAVPVAEARVTVSLSRHHKNRFVGHDHEAWFVNTYPTDGEGRFVCDQLPVDRVYDLYLQHGEHGYRNVGQVEFPEGGDRVDVGVVLTTAGHPVEGLVVDRAGRPVAGAAVEIGDFRTGPSVLGFRFPSAPMRGAETRTGADGRFACRGLSEGVHRLLVRHPEFAPHAEPEVRVGSAGQLDELRLVLDPPGHLAGVVVDDAERPLPGATVEVLLDEQAFLGEVGYAATRYLRRTRAGADGRFRLDGLPGGPGTRFLVNAAAPGFDEEQTSGLMPGDEAVRIVLRGGDRPGDGPCTIRGRLAAAGGGGWPRGRKATVEVADRHQATGRQRVQVGADGEFAISGAAAGELALTVDAAGFLTRTVPLDCAAGEVDAGTVELDPGLTIFGRITDQGTGRPIPGATVRYLDRHQVRADAAGFFEMSGFERRDTTNYGALSALATGYMPVSPPLRLKADRERVQHDIGLEPWTAGRTVLGRVVGPDGTPVAGALVRLAHFARSTLTERRTRTGLDGGFRFPAIPPAAGALEGTLLLTHPDFAPQVVRRERLDELPGEVTLGPGRPVRGRVVDQHGRPVAGARVGTFTATGDGTRLPDVNYLTLKAAVADGDGRFALEHVRDEPVFLLPAAAGCRVPPEAAAKDYRLGAGGRSELRLVLERGQRIAGRVVDPDGRPLAGVRIFAHGVRSGAVLTDRDGGFGFDGVFVPLVDLRLSGDGVEGMLKDVRAGSTGVLLQASRK